MVGRDVLKIGGTEYSCFRVEWLYFNFVDNADIHATEWIAEEGLIQRIVEVSRQDLISPDGTFLSNVESKEVLQLVDIHLK